MSAATPPTPKGGEMESSEDVPRPTKPGLQDRVGLLLPGLEDFPSHSLSFWLAPKSSLPLKGGGGLLFFRGT